MDNRALLITRPKGSAERFVAGLDQAVLRGVTICASPLLEIVPTKARVELDGVSGVIFSSAQGVAHAPGGNGRLAYCVGEKTAEQAQAHGWHVALVRQTAQALIDHLIAALPNGPLVHLAGVHRRGDIAEHLQQAGLPVDVITLYEQVLRPLTQEAQKLLAGEAPVVVPLFSPRTAVQFARQADGTRQAHIVAISQSVADAVDGSRFASVYIAAEPTSKQMRRAVEMLLRRDSLT